MGRGLASRSQAFSLKLPSSSPEPLSSALPQPHDRRDGARPVSYTHLQGYAAGLIAPNMLLHGDVIEERTVLT